MSYFFQAGFYLSCGNETAIISCERLPMTLHKKTKISAPAEKVWPLVSDPLLMSSWNQLIRTVIPVTLGEPKAGTRYRIRYGLLWGESNYSAELMEFEKHSRCVLHLEGGHLPRKGYIQEIYEIQERPDGCFVSQTILIDLAGRLFPLSLGIRLRHFIGKASARRSLNKLKGLAESSEGILHIPPNIPSP